jgi:hypothetical protein
MSNLPPELAELNAQYAQIFERYNAGQLTEEQARMTLENIVTVDGAGCTWRINPEPEGEEFLRAQPGGPFQPCNPMYFQPLTTPPSHPMATPAWQQAPTSPGQFPGNPVPGEQPGFPPGGAMPGFFEPTPPFGTQPGFAPQTGFAPGAPGHQGHVPAGDASFAYGQPWSQEPLGASMPQATGTPARTGGIKAALGGLVATLTADRRRLVGVAVIVVALVAFVSLRGGGEETTEVTPPAPTIPVTAPTPVVPVPTETTQPSPEPAEPGALPTDADLDRVRAALSSAQRETAAAVLVSPGSLHRQFTASATWAGLGAVGIDLTVEPVTVDEADTERVTQRLVLVDRSTGQAVSTATLVWKLGAAGVWQLETWPAIERVE